MIPSLIVVAALSCAPAADAFDEDEAAQAVVTIGFGTASAFSGAGTLASVASSGVLTAAYFVWRDEGRPRFSETDGYALAVAAISSVPAIVLGAAMTGGGGALIYFGRATLAEQLSRLEPRKRVKKRAPRRKRNDWPRRRR